MGVADVLFTVKDAKQFWGVAESTVWSWISRYRIPARGRKGKAKLYRFGDLSEAELQARHSYNQRKPRYGSGDSSRIA